MTEAAKQYAALPLCSGCYDGRTNDELLARGINLHTVDETSIDGEDFISSSCVALGASPFELPLRASFGREGFIGRKLKIDLQTGDRVFDDAVSIEGDGPTLRAFLGLEPVRLAILDLVGCAKVTIEDGVIQVRVTGHCGREDLRRSVAVLTWGASRVGEELHLANTTARAVLPWLDLLPSQATQISVTVQGGRVEPRHLGALVDLRSLSLFDVQLTSADLTPLDRLSRLQSLMLQRVPQVCELGAISRIAGLSSLTLTACPVVDLSPIERLRGLRSLDLSGTRVSDLTPLQTLRELRELYLTHAPVSPQQLEALRKHLPDTRIVAE